MSSHGIVIRDAIIARAEAMQEGATIQMWNKVNKQPGGTMQPDEMPTLGVFTMRERMIPDGDGNAGPLQFIHDVTIGLSIALKESNPDNADAALDAKIEALLTKLFGDPSFVSFAPGALFESIEQIDRTRIFPDKGEAYYVEGRVAITFRYRTYWEPVIPDNLEKVHVENKTFPEGTPQVKSEYDLETE